jgi:pyrroloquinoline quinone biosynthesis protein E
MAASRPYTLVAELTYRCPLRCLYCSNPLEFHAMQDELSTEQWCQTFTDAAELGVVQVHLSGGEPLVRNDLPALIRHARECDLYTNLITSGTLLNEVKLKEFRAAVWSIFSSASRTPSVERPSWWPASDRTTRNSRSPG